jgi:serine/threonine protein kinase
MKDYYSVLQVSPRASREVVKAAYHALIRQYHPDVNPGHSVRARDINEAYEVLSDPDKRQRYDQLGFDVSGKMVGNYRVMELIAEGGFGRTYKGVHSLTGMEVCIKHCLRVSPEDDEIILEEARAMWDLRHFSIPAVRDVIRHTDGSVILVMSYIPGQTLEKYVEKLGSLDAEHVAWIAERLLNALKYLHYHGVIHGDMKPQNVIIQPDSHTVVTVDFGLSLVKPGRNSSPKGYTPYFASPEHIAQTPLVPESDFYGLGMTLIYALCGGKLSRLQAKEIPVSVPHEFSEFIRRLVARDVWSRPRWEYEPGGEDLTRTIVSVRQKSFGRAHSNMKPLPKI